MTINDVLAALGVVLNGIPQALLAATYGFASIPTAFGFIVGAVACLLYGSAIPISFQAETIALAGMLGKDIRERLSIILFSGLAMVILGLTGALSTIVNFAGSTIINAMMAGVGIMLTRIALSGLKESRVVTASSIVSAFITYFFFGQNLLQSGGVVAFVLAGIVMLTQFLQSYLSIKAQPPLPKEEPKKDGDPAMPMLDPRVMQKMTLYVFPFMIGVSALFLPIGLGLYWWIGLLFMIIQQIFVNAQAEKQKQKGEIVTRK